MPVLETEHLTLHEMSLEDLDFVATMLSDSQVMRFYPKPLSRDEARDWVLRQIGRYAEHGYGLWLVLSRELEQPVGQVGLVRREIDSATEHEIVYLVHRPFWRRGFATEAALGVRDHAFGPLGLRRLISLIRPENVPSRAVASKLGMTPERETLYRGLRHTVFAVEAGEVGSD